jgi:hypothetical protein
MYRLTREQPNTPPALVSQGGAIMIMGKYFGKSSTLNLCDKAAMTAPQFYRQAGAQIQ